MRLESFIRKSLRLKAHSVTEVQERPDEMLVRIDWIRGRRVRCGACGRRAARVVHRQAERRWRDLSLRDRSLTLTYRPCRVRCRVCGVRVEKVPWASRWQRITDALLASVARLSRMLSWKETAGHFRLDWKTVAAAVKRAVAWGLEHRPWKPLRVIGIDEVSRSKGQRYLTLVYDLERNRLVWIGENRDADTMRRFFAWLGPRRARSILIVCCDMWAVYVAAMREKLPHAFLVFDRFHVVQHLNKAVDEVRRQCWKRLTGEAKSAFKKTRWLWLKNPWNLKDEEKRRLSALCRTNQPIVRAYYLKEAFQRFWDYKSPSWSAPYLKQWLWWANHSRLDPFRRFARLVRKHLDGILRWTELRVANGALEGMNNKVKVVSHRAYGFRKVNTYVTAIWHGCGDLPLP
jgi:transposase